MGQHQDAQRKTHAQSDDQLRGDLHRRTCDRNSKVAADYIQKLTAQVIEQTKEFIDLSTRASQHVFEKAQTATSKSFKTAL